MKNKFFKIFLGLFMFVFIRINVVCADNNKTDYFEKQKTHLCAVLNFNYLGTEMEQDIIDRNNNIKKPSSPYSSFHFPKTCADNQLYRIYPEKLAHNEQRMPCFSYNNQPVHPPLKHPMDVLLIFQNKILP